MNADSYTSRDVYETVTILAGETISTAADLSGTRLIGMHVPTGFDGNNLKFLTALDAQSGYHAVHDDSNTPLQNNITAQSFSAIEPSKTLLIRHLKLQSNTAQATDITITLIARPL